MAPVLVNYFSHKRAVVPPVPKITYFPSYLSRLTAGTAWFGVSEAALAFRSAVSPALHPAFASGEEAGHNPKAGTVRSSSCDKL